MCTLFLRSCVCGHIFFVSGSKYIICLVASGRLDVEGRVFV